MYIILHIIPTPSFCSKTTGRIETRKRQRYCRGRFEDDKSWNRDGEI